MFCLHRCTIHLLSKHLKWKLKKNIQKKVGVSDSLHDILNSFVWRNVHLLNFQLHLYDEESPFQVSKSILTNRQILY